MVERSNIAVVVVLAIRWKVICVLMLRRSCSSVLQLFVMDLRGDCDTFQPIFSLEALGPGSPT